MHRKGGWTGEAQPLCYKKYYISFVLYKISVQKAILI